MLACPVCTAFNSVPPVGMTNSRLFLWNLLGKSTTVYISHKLHTTSQFYTIAYRFTRWISLFVRKCQPQRVIKCTRWKHLLSSILYLPLHLRYVSHCLRVWLSLTTKKTLKFLWLLWLLCQIVSKIVRIPHCKFLLTQVEKMAFLNRYLLEPESDLRLKSNQRHMNWNQRFSPCGCIFSSDSWCEQHKLKLSSPWCAQRQACQSTVVDVVGGWQPFPRGFQGEQTRGVQGAETGWWVRWVFNFICFGGFRGCSLPRWWRKTAFLGTWNLKQSEARKNNCRQKFNFLLFWSRCLLAVIVWSIVLYILLVPLL